MRKKFTGKIAGLLVFALVVDAENTGTGGWRYRQGESAVF
jgi:hypothetical protein